ncbi:MAG: hypothetical protein ACK4OM_01105 [Alphaproteobacteria bacterium]
MKNKITNLIKNSKPPKFLEKILREDLHDEKHPNVIKSPKFITGLIEVDSYTSYFREKSQESYSRS